MYFDLAIRQGDILFLKVEKLPDDCVKQETNVIKEGESSGHSHKVVFGSVNFYKQITTEQNKNEFLSEQIIGYLEVTDKAVIGHEEHKPIYLPEGFYRILQQRVFDPFEGGNNYASD